MMTASNIHYEVSGRSRRLGPGGIGAIHLLARRTGLIEEVDANLHVLKRHSPYHESDHVLNIAYNILTGGTRLEHIELWRNDENYLNAQSHPLPVLQRHGSYALPGAEGHAHTDHRGHPGRYTNGSG